MKEKIENVIKFIEGYVIECPITAGCGRCNEARQHVAALKEGLKDVNQEVERRIAETVAGKFIAVEIEKRIADRFPSKEEILKYFNNHFNCYTDVTIRDYETTEIAMTNIAVLKMFEWLRSRLVSQKTDNLKENNNNGSTN